MEKFSFGNLFENKANKKEAAEKEKNYAEVETENAKYKIAYGDHTKKTSAEALEGADALILELISNYGSMEQAEDTFSFLNGTEQYKDLIESAIEKKIPICVVDLSEDTLNSLSKAGSGSKETELGTHGKKLTYEAAGGLALFLSLFSNIQAKEPMSRRNFLKSSFKMAAAAYLGAPLLETSLLEKSADGKNINENALDRQTTKTLGKINSTLHPELSTATIHGRNLLMAQKAEFLSEMLKQDLERKPQVAVVVGAAHYGIENDLEKPEAERMEKIKKFLGDEYKKEGVVARFDVSRPGQGDSTDKLNVSTSLYFDGNFSK